MLRSSSNSSDSVATGHWLAVFGMVWLVGGACLGWHDLPAWSEMARLGVRGRPAPALIRGVNEVRGDRWVSYQVAYSFKPEGQPEQYGTVAVGSDELRAIGGTSGTPRMLAGTTGHPAVARYLPEDPAVHRLEGVMPSIPIGGVLCLFIGAVIVVGGLRMARIDPALSIPPPSTHRA